MDNTALKEIVGDLFDANGDCTHKTWKHNTFTTADPPCLK
jgi:hypothetical protein